MDDEVKVAIAKASAAFGRIYSNVWRKKGITLQINLTVGVLCHRYLNLAICLLDVDSLSTSCGEGTTSIPPILDNFWPSSRKKVPDTNWHSTIIQQSFIQPKHSTILMWN